MTAHKDLRSFVEWLESESRLVRVAETVATRFGVARYEEKYDGRRAVLFEDIDGHDMPIVANIFNCRENIAAALGLIDGHALTERLMEASQNPLPTRLVEDAPCKEVHIEGSDVDLESQLPNPTHFDKDAGPYISSGVIVARDPVSKKRNLSFARMMIKDANTIHIMVNSHRHLAEIHRRMEAQGRDLEVAIVIGVDPATWLEGAMSDRIVPIDVDELEVAGALRREPLDVVTCTTLDLEAPASAEIVLEGLMLADVRAEEGPYGDYSRVYDGPPRMHPVIKIHTITHRRDPIYLDCLPGGFDNWLLGGVCREADILQHLQRSMPHVKAVCLPPGGCSRFHAVVQISKQNESDPMHAIIGTLSPTEATRDVKWVIVVDDDIDPFDPLAVEWAIATRTQWDRDLVIIPRMGMALDPSAIARTPPAVRAGGAILSTKTGLDATIPLDQPEHIESYRRVTVPEDDDPATGPTAVHDFG